MSKSPGPQDLKGACPKPSPHFWSHTVCPGVNTYLLRLAV